MSMDYPGVSAPGFRPPTPTEIQVYKARPVPPPRMPPSGNGRTVVIPPTQERPLDLVQMGFPWGLALSGLAALLSGASLAETAGQVVSELPSAMAPGGNGAVGGGPMTYGLQEYGIRGPGVPEPAAGTVMRQWSLAVHSNTRGTFRLYFFKMFDGYTLMYNPSTKSWKKWRQRKSIILPRGRTTISQAVKAQKYLDRMWRTVAKRTKALKLA